MKAVVLCGGAGTRLREETEFRPKSFNEKPRTDGWMSAGYFALNRVVLDYLNGDDCVFERQPLEQLTADGELMAFRHDGFFFAMDTFREYQHLNELWSSEAVPWRVWA